MSAIFSIAFFLWAAVGNAFVIPVPESLMALNQEIDNYIIDSLEKLEVIQNAYFSSKVMLVKRKFLGLPLGNEGEAIEGIKNALFSNFAYFQLQDQETHKLAQDFFARFQDDYDFFVMNEQTLRFDVCLVLKYEDEYEGKTSIIMAPKGLAQNGALDQPIWILTARSKIVD